MRKTEELCAVAASIVCGAAVAFFRGYDWVGLIFCVLLRGLYTAVGIVDFERHIIPNRLLAILLLIKTVFLLIAKDGGMLENSLLGAALMTAAVLAVYFSSRIIKKDGAIGFGDYKYLAALGYCCGINNLFGVFVCSLAFAVLAVMIEHDGKKRIAAGAYFSIGAVLLG